MGMVLATYPLKRAVAFFCEGLSGGKPRPGLGSVRDLVVR